MRTAWLLLLFLLVPQWTTGEVDPSAPSPLERTILSLYDSRVTPNPYLSWSHQMAELPLNHLGFRVLHWDIGQSLPTASALAGVRGVLMWSQSAEMRDPIAFLRWAEKLAESGKRFVIMGSLAFSANLEKRPTPTAQINRFLNKVGLRLDEGWSPITYDLEVTHKDPKMVGYERDLLGVLNPVEQVQAQGDNARVYLSVRHQNQPDSESHLVVVSDSGGYASNYYTHYEDEEKNRRAWILNPFEFFRLSFSSDDLPKLDVTTLSGRRIYYSHIDGDGWRNTTQVPEYTRRLTSAAEVVYREALLKYPELPVTVAPIAADLDPRWFGSERIHETARQILALPQVEAGTHTYSHPFQWSFFEDATPEKERPFLRLYEKSWQPASGLFWLYRLLGLDTQTEVQDTGDFEVPRAYAVEPFNLELEIQGSIDYIERFLPAGKKVRLVQWSGDTQPFPEAVQKAQTAGVPNLNGGDSRFDREFSSVAWVSPVGRYRGNLNQIYASNSNENTYTDLWTDRYFGFIHLVRTFENTESPFRLKPLNVYYHMYSGEKLSSLNALRANLQYVKTQELCPIEASRYSLIGEGFYSAELIPLGESSWKVAQRGAIQTVRFDRATFKAVDLGRSVGVLGQRHYQGSLYVALDRVHKNPIVTLQEIDSSDYPPPAPQSYLIHSTWDVWGLQHTPSGFSFQTRGYGKGKQVWQSEHLGPVSVTWTQTGPTPKKLQIAAREGKIEFEIDSLVPKTFQVQVTHAGSRRP